jgi:L-fuconolactonase
MSTPKPHSTVATRMSGIREDWLRLTQEEVLEPDLAIVDPHHHLWDFPAHRYLLPDLLAETDSGHKIESTVFIECTACYRTDGPPELRTLGETEFVNGIAAMSASGAYGPTRVAAGIVGLVDLTIGDRAEEVLRAPWPPPGRASKASDTQLAGRTRPPRSITATPIRRLTSIVTMPSSGTALRRWAGLASRSMPGSTTPRSRI